MSSLSTASLERSEQPLKFKISLAGWCLHQAIYGHLVKMLDFPRIARQTFGLEAIELVNTLFEVPTQEYISAQEECPKRECQDPSNHVRR